jgi:hypothetical protein
MPKAPLEERVVRFAVAAFLATQKDTPSATKRCLKRRQRALKRLETAEPIPGAVMDFEARSAATVWLRNSCDVCGKCRGIEIKPPR